MANRYNLRSRPNLDVKRRKLNITIDKKPQTTKIEPPPLNEEIINQCIEKYMTDRKVEFDHALLNELTKSFKNILTNSLETIIDSRLETFETDIHETIHEHFEKFDELIDIEVLEDIIVDTVEDRYRPFFDALRRLRKRQQLDNPDLVFKKVKLTDNFGPPERNFTNKLQNHSMILESYLIPEQSLLDPTLNPMLNTTYESIPDPTLNPTPTPSTTLGLPPLEPTLEITPEKPSEQHKPKKASPKRLEQHPALRAIFGDGGGGLIMGRPPPGNALPEKYDVEALTKLAKKPKYVKELIDLKTHDENKSIIYGKIFRYHAQHCPGKERDNDQKWLDKVFKLPFDKIVEYPISKQSSNSKIREITGRLFKGLNEKVNGLQEVKEEIIVEFIKRLLNPDAKGKIIVLEGPPGIGKTFIAHNLASLIGLPFDSISLGGCTDSSLLIGSDELYVGSHEGAIAKGLQRMGYSNGLLYLDEIDKIGETPRAEEVSSSLLSVLDETQNYKFKDNYYHDIEINLSRLFTIGSANDRNKIPPILRNRMKFITIPAPTTQEKIDLVKNFFIPFYYKEFDITEEEIRFPDETIKYIMSITEEEPGVRGLKRNVEHIISRLNFLKRTTIVKQSTIEEGEIVTDEFPKLSFMISNFTLPFVVYPDDVDMLKDKRLNDKKDTYGMYM